MSSDETNPLGDDVLHALRQRVRAEVPAAVRARVAARLAGAGVGVLATAASAAAASSLKAGGAAGALSAVALAKPFAVGIAIGVGTAVTAYVVSAERSEGAADVRPAALAKASAKAAFVATAATTPAAPPAPPAPRAAETRLINPAPELPRSAHSAASPRAIAATSSPGLTEQQALLDNARARLRNGDASGALTMVDQHRARFPRTAFEEEREALAIRALVALGQGAAARTRTRTFARRFPSSLALSALQEATTPRRETVTERSAPSQTPSEGSALRRSEKAHAP